MISTGNEMVGFNMELIAMKEMVVQPITRMHWYITTRYFHKIRQDTNKNSDQELVKLTFPKYFKKFSTWVITNGLPFSFNLFLISPLEIK